MTNDPCDYSGLQEFQFRTGCNHHMQWDVLSLWSPYWPALNPCEAPWTPEFQPESSSETTHHPETLKLVSYSTAGEFEGHQSIDDLAEFLALISSPFIDQSSRSQKKPMPLTTELWSFFSLVFAPYFGWSTPKLVMVKVPHCNCNRWSQYISMIISHHLFNKKLISTSMIHLPNPNNIIVIIIIITITSIITITINY